MHDGDAGIFRRDGEEVLVDAIAQLGGMRKKWHWGCEETSSSSGQNGSAMTVADIAWLRQDIQPRD